MVQSRLAIGRAGSLMVISSRYIESSHACQFTPWKMKQSSDEIFLSIVEIQFITSAVSWAGIEKRFDYTVEWYLMWAASWTT